MNRRSNGILVLVMAISPLSEGGKLKGKSNGWNLSDNDSDLFVLSYFIFSPMGYLFIWSRSCPQVPSYWPKVFFSFSYHLPLRRNIRKGCGSREAAVESLWDASRGKLQGVNGLFTGACQNHPEDTTTPKQPIDVTERKTLNNNWLVVYILIRIDQAHDNVLSGRCRSP